jgi:hypothetical protein
LFISLALSSGQKVGSVGMALHQRGLSEALGKPLPLVYNILNEQPRLTVEKCATRARLSVAWAIQQLIDTLGYDEGLRLPKRGKTAKRSRFE